MSLRCLLFSHDDRTFRLLRLSLSDLSIDVEHCTDFEQCQNLLLQRKFDAVVSDCDLQNGPALLRSVRQSKHNRRSIIFALADAQIKMSEAFQMGADFILYKPLTPERIRRTLHAAHGLMMRERRLHFRHPTSTPVMLNPKGRPLRVQLCDLSPNGALIDAGMALKTGQVVEMHFRLPDTEFDMELTGRVTRCDPMGRAGVRFEGLSEVAEARLMQWTIDRSLEAPQAPAQDVGVVVNLNRPHATPETDQLDGVDFQVEVIEPMPDDDIQTRQRATLRGQHHAAIKILAFDNGAPLILQGKCRNISEIGLAATLDEELALGTAVLLQVELPGAPKLIVLHALTRRQEDHLYAFEYVAVDLSLKKLIRDCVADLPVE